MLMSTIVALGQSVGDYRTRYTDGLCALSPACYSPKAASSFKFMHNPFLGDTVLQTNVDYYYDGEDYNWLYSNYPVDPYDLFPNYITEYSNGNVDVLNNVGVNAYNWSVATNWETWNGVAWVVAASAPDSINNVTIRKGSFYLLNAAIVKTKNLTIENFAELCFYMDFDLYTFTNKWEDINVTIKGDLTINPKGVFKHEIDFRSPTNSDNNFVRIYGNVYNYGIFDLYENIEGLYAGYSDLYIEGSTNTDFITYTNSTLNLYSMFLTKDNVDDTLNFVYNGGVLSCQNYEQYGFLYMYELGAPAGTFRLSGSGTFNYFLFNPDGLEYGVGADCKFVLDNPNAAIGGNGLFANKTAPFKLKGEMDIKQGNIMYIGNNTDVSSYNDLVMFNNSVFTMESGQLGVLGAFIDSSCTACTYNQTGGNVFVGVKQGKYPSRGSFDLREASFNMSGGYINLVNAGAFSPDYQVDDASPNITGGFLQTGCGSSPNGTINWEIRGTVPGLLTYKNGTKIGNVILWGNTTAYYTTNIKAGTGFQFDNNVGGNYTYTQKGDSLLFYGDFFGDLINSKLVFNGSNKQYFYSVGGYYDPGLWELEINNSNDVVLAGGNTEVGVNLRLSNGKFYTGDNFIIMSTGATSTRTNGWVIGNIKKYFSTGAQIFRYDYGTENGYSPSEITFGNVTVSDYLVSTVINANHPTPLPTDSTKTIKRYWDFDITGSIIAFNNYTAKFTYLKEDFNLFKDYPNEQYMNWGKYSSSWIFPTVAARDTLNNNATLSGLTSFSTFTAMLIPPKITQEPKDSLICAGNEVKFGLVADTGTAPLTYKWQVNKNDGGGFVDLVEGGTSPKYTGVANDTLKITETITAIDSFFYRCVVVGLVSPNDTSLTVVLNVDSAIATPNTLAATSITTAGFTANWNKVNSVTEYLITIATDSLFGASIVLNNQSTGTDTTYNASGLNANTDYWYRVVAKNHCNIVSQNSDSIKVKTLLGCTSVSIATQPSNPSAVCGGTNTITIPFEVAGSTNFDYQWQIYNTGTLAWDNLSNVAPYTNAVTNASASIKDTLIITNVSNAYNGKKFRCIITNCAGANKDTTNEITITVNSPITIDAGVDKTICSGTTITLKAIGATSYSWSTTAVIDSVNITPLSDSTFYVTGTSGACSDKDTIMVKVDSPINVNAGVDKTVCSGSLVTFKAIGATSYSWSTIAVIDSINVTPLSDSTFYVIGTSGACTDKDTVVVNVDSPISVNASIDKTICLGSTITLKAIGASSYSWSTTAVIDSVNITPLSDSTFYVTGTSGACSDKDTVVVKVDSPINVNAGVDKTVCSGSLVTFKATGATSYSWSTTAVIDSINVSPVLNSTYYVIGTSGACTDKDTVEVKVDSPISVNAGIDKTICSGNTITLKATGASSYSWSTTAVIDSINVSPVANSTYYVIGTTGACTDKDTVEVKIDSPITVDAGVDRTICGGDLVTFKATGANSYSWSTTATIDSINVSPVANSTYYVIGTSGACTDKDTVEVKIDSPITVDAGVDRTICSRDSVNLKVTGGNTYIWSNGSTLDSLWVKPLVDVTYYVTATSGACTAKDTVIISIAIPSVEANSIIKSNDFFCPGTIDTLTIDGGSLGYNAVWIWYNENYDSIATGDTLIATFDSTTTISLAAVGTCDVTGLTTTIVSANKTLSVIADSIAKSTDNICSLENVLLSVSGGVLGSSASWNWYADSTFTQFLLTGPTLPVNPDSTKSYWVRALGLCNNTLAKKTTVTVSQTLSITPDSIISNLDNVCPQTDITFSVAGGSLGSGAIWAWYSDSLLTNVSKLKGNLDTFYTFKSDSTTTIWLSGTGACGSTAKLSKTVNIKTNPIIPDNVYITHPISAIVISDYCINNIPDSIVLNYNGGNLGTGGVANWYIKNPNNILIGIGNNIKVSALPSDMKYYVRFEADCDVTDFDSTSIVVKPIATVNTTDTTVCENSQINITVTGNADSYLWSDNLGTGSSKDITVSSSYTYYITASLNGCDVKDSVVITSKSLPTANASADISICSGDSTQVSVLGNATSYIWDNGLGNNVFSKVKPTITTTYNVTGTLNGCTNSDYTVVIVYNSPIVNLTKDTTICVGSTIELVLNNTYTYTWSNNSNASTITLDPTVDTKYFVTIFSLANCTNVDSINVLVNTVLADFTVDSLEGFEPLSVVFTDNSVSAISYHWDFGDNNTSTEQNPAYTYTTKGSYPVILTVTSSAGCQDTASLTILVKEKPFSFKIPNVITPNGDMINDYFKIEGDGLNSCIIKIFNRWGTYITEIDNCKEGWDGTLNGNDVPDGVYFYTITLTNNAGENKDYKGFFELVR